MRKRGIVWIPETEQKGKKKTTIPIKNPFMGELADDLEIRYAQLKKTLGRGSHLPYWELVSHPMLSFMFGQHDPESWPTMGRFDAVKKTGSVKSEDEQPPFFKNPGPPSLEDIEPKFYSKWSSRIYPHKDPKEWPKKQSLRFWGPLDDFSPTLWLNPDKYYGFFEVDNAEVRNWQNIRRVKAQGMYDRMVHFLDPGSDVEPLLFRVNTDRRPYRFVGSSSHNFRPKKWLDPDKSYQVMELSVKKGRNFQFYTKGKRPHIIDGTGRLFKKPRPHLPNYVGKNGNQWLKAPPGRPKARTHMNPRYFGPKELFHPEHWLEPGKEYRPYQILGANTKQDVKALFLHDNLEDILYGDGQMKPSKWERMWRFEMEVPNSVAYGYYEMKETPIRGALGRFLPDCVRAKYGMYPLTPKSKVKPHVLYTNDEWPQNPLWMEKKVEKAFGPLPKMWQREPKPTLFNDARKKWLTDGSMDEWHEPRLRQFWDPETKQMEPRDPRTFSMRWNPTRVGFDDPDQGAPHELHSKSHQAKIAAEQAERDTAQQPKHESDKSAGESEHGKESLNVDDQHAAGPKEVDSGPSEKALGKRPMVYDDHPAEGPSGPSEKALGKRPMVYDDHQAEDSPGPSEKALGKRPMVYDNDHPKGATNQVNGKLMSPGTDAARADIHDSVRAKLAPVRGQGTGNLAAPQWKEKVYRTGREVVADVLADYKDLDGHEVPVLLDGKPLWVKQIDVKGPKKAWEPGFEWFDGTNESPMPHDDFIRDIPGFKATEDHPFWMSGALGDQALRKSAESTRSTIIKDIFDNSLKDVGRDIHGVNFADMIPAAPREFTNIGTKVGQATAVALEEVIEKSIGRMALQMVEKAVMAAFAELMGDGVLTPLLIAIDAAMVGQMMFDLVGRAVPYHHGKCSRDRNACISDIDLTEHHCHSLHQCRADGEVCAFRTISPSKVVCDWKKYNAWSTATQYGPTSILLKEAKVKVHRHRVKVEAKTLLGLEEQSIAANCSSPNPGGDCHNLKEAINKIRPRIVHNMQYTSLYRSPHQAKKARKLWKKSLEYTETVINKDKGAIAQAETSRKEMVAPGSRHTHHQQHHLDKHIKHAKHTMKKHLKHLKHLMKRAQKAALKADALAFVDPYQVCEEDMKDIQMLYQRAVNGTYAGKKKDSKSH